MLAFGSLSLFAIQSDLFIPGSTITYPSLNLLNHPDQLLHPPPPDVTQSLPVPTQQATQLPDHQSSQFWNVLMSMTTMFPLVPAIPCARMTTQVAQISLPSPP